MLHIIHCKIDKTSLLIICAEALQTFTSKDPSLNSSKNVSLSFLLMDLISMYGASYYSL